MVDIEHLKEQVERCNPDEIWVTDSCMKINKPYGDENFWKAIQYTLQYVADSKYCPERKDEIAEMDKKGYKFGDGHHDAMHDIRRLLDGLGFYTNL